MNIYVWGTGRIAGKIVGKWISIDKVTAFVDRNETINEYMGKRVIRPKQLLFEEYDAIIVANLFSKEIEEECRQLGIEMSKIIYPYENTKLMDMNEDYSFVINVLGEYGDIIKNRYHMVRGVEAYDAPQVYTQFAVGGEMENIIRLIMCAYSALIW